jgi:hypothetical protein
MAVLRRLLHDHELGLRERFAGSVLLLPRPPERPRAPSSSAVVHANLEEPGCSVPQEVKRVI